MKKVTTHTQPRIGKRQHVANPNTTIIFPRETVKTTRVELSADVKRVVAATHTLVECVCCGFKFPREHLHFGGRCDGCHVNYKRDTAKSGMVAYHAY